MSYEPKNNFKSARSTSHTSSPSTSAFSPASTRTFSGSVKDTINHFEPIQVKQEHILQNGTSFNLNEPGSEPELTEHVTDHVIGQTQTDTMTTNANIIRNSTTQADISLMQRDSVEKFNTALKSLLSEYMPAPLLQPHPNLVHPSGTSSSSSSTSTSAVPSLLEMEVRHAIGQAARNVYHAHIRDDKKRKAFDFKYAELQDLYFGKGRKVAREMKRLARDGGRCKNTAEDDDDDATTTTEIGRRVGELNVGTGTGTGTSRPCLRENGLGNGQVFDERVGGREQEMMDIIEN